MGGNILCVMPWSGDFPFDTLGGVGMAVCFVYIIYKQYLFSFSMRATTGAVYLIAVVVAFLPMIILEPNIDHVIGQTDSFTKQFITVFVVLQCLWMVLVMSYARKWLERILYQKKKHIVESLVEFQDMAASILNKKNCTRKSEAPSVRQYRTRMHVFLKKEMTILWSVRQTETGCWTQRRRQG